MIIIEGPDGTGKSTLAESLRKELRMGKQLIEHCGPPPKTEQTAESGAWVQYLDMISDGKLQTHTIMDRFIYGERVYGPILRNDRRFTLAHQRMIERVLFTRRPVVIFTHPPYKTGFDNWHARQSAGKELFTNPMWYKNTWDTFEKVRTQVSLPCLTWDPFRLPVAELARQIDIIKGPVNLGPGHGMFSRTSTLLVGDFMSSLTRPFDWTGVQYEGPMYELTQQLVNAEIPEGDLYWVNSHVLTSSGNRLRDANWLNALNPRKIIAVGDHGDQWCDQIDRSYASVPGVTAWFRRHPLSEHPIIHEVLTT